MTKVEIEILSRPFAYILSVEPERPERWFNIHFTMRCKSNKKKMYGIFRLKNPFEPKVFGSFESRDAITFIP